MFGYNPFINSFIHISSFLNLRLLKEHNLQPLINITIGHYPKLGHQLTGWTGEAAYTNIMVYSYTEQC